MNKRILKRIKQLLFIVVILVILVFIYRFLALEYNFFIPCLFYEFTNFYCPGCGITRLLFALFDLNFYQAFRYNPLLFIFLPFIGYCFVDSIIKFILGREDYFCKKIKNRVWYILLVIILLFGVFRNIPMFEFLKPTVL